MFDHIPVSTWVTQTGLVICFWRVAQGLEGGSGDKERACDQDALSEIIK